MLKRRRIVEQTGEYFLVIFRFSTPMRLMYWRSYSPRTERVGLDISNCSASRSIGCPTRAKLGQENPLVFRLCFQRLGAVSSSPFGEFYTTAGPHPAVKRGASKCLLRITR